MKHGLSRRYGALPEEAAEDLRVHLVRISRRRKRLKLAGVNNLRDVRKRIAEAVAAGISLEMSAAMTGYKLETVMRWLNKQKKRPRVVPVETAQCRLELIDQQRRRTVQRDLEISARAKALVRKAMAAGIAIDEFALLTGYTKPRVSKWFASVRRSLEQAQRQRELIAIQRGKGSRPPQHLSETEYDRWLVEADYKRRKVLRRYGLWPQGRRPNRQSTRRGRGRKRQQTTRSVPQKRLTKGSGKRRKRPRK